jgi:DNA-binding SARP family transcriptional activator
MSQCSRRIGATLEIPWGVCRVSTRVYVTGRVCIEGAGKLVDEQQFPGRQGRLLFAYLVCHRQRPITRAELADALWPGDLPSAWETALNALVSELRAVLRGVKPTTITLAGVLGGYLLQVGDDAWIDREAAAEAIDQAEGMLRSNDWKGAWGPSNIAAITARQPFLGGEEAEWITRERMRLQSILLRALDCLTEIWLQNGEPSLALEAAREGVALEPYCETGYQRLMRIHVALGNRAEALRVYERCRLLLANELGTDPSPETQKVYQDLLGPA